MSNDKVTNLKIQRLYHEKFVFFLQKWCQKKGYNFCEVRIGTLTIHELWPPWKLTILKQGHGRGSKDLVEVTGELDQKIGGSKEIVLNKV